MIESQNKKLSYLLSPILLKSLFYGCWLDVETKTFYFPGPEITSVAVASPKGIILSNYGNVKRLKTLKLSY